MKFIPDAIGRKIAQQGLLASENSPKILFGAGVVGMIGSTVLACRATLKLEETLEVVETDRQKAHDVHELVNKPDYDGDATYTDQEMRKDLTIITVRGVGNVAKLYAPAILLGAASIMCLTKSHSILQERNLGLTAAYAAVDTAFSKYRERVIERYGENADREMRYEAEQIDVVDEETGKITSELRAIDAPGSTYARFYDEHASRNWSPDPDINLLFLRNVQNYMNDRLRSRGHVFLNEVYGELGLSHTTPGAVVGWRWNKESGDDFIDFGIWQGRSEKVNDFFNGREGSILLDFNVDGVIYDKIEESY
jgi:hypothetical protein